MTLNAAEMSPDYFLNVKSLSPLHTLRPLLPRLFSTYFQGIIFLIAYWNYCVLTELSEDVRWIIKSFFSDALMLLVGKCISYFPKKSMFFYTDLYRWP